MAAWFQYDEFIDSVYLVLNIDFDNFESFFTFIIEYFWTWTERVLKLIRKNILETLYTRYLDAINVLETSIRAHDCPEVHDITQEIINNCNQCKTRVNSLIQEFSDVFRRPITTYNDFNMTELVETCTKIAQSLYPKYNTIKVDTYVKDENVFLGRSFSFFVDVLNILIGNAIQHSGYDNLADLSLGIDIEQVSFDDYSFLYTTHYENILNQPSDDATFVWISVSNNLASCKDIEAVNSGLKRFDESLFFDNLAQEHIQTEGGSGLYKLFKTIRYNIVPRHFYTLYIIDKDSFQFTIAMETTSLLKKE